MPTTAPTRKEKVRRHGRNAFASRSSLGSMSIPALRSHLRNPNTTMMAKSSRRPIGVSTANNPRTSNATTSGAWRPDFTCRNTRYATTAARRTCSDDGENQQNAFHTGSEQQNKAAPWKRTKSTHARHHRATCSPRRRAAGTSISKIRTESTAITPSDTWPAMRRTASAFTIPKFRQSGPAMYCHSKEVVPVGGRNPAATERCSIRSGGTESNCHAHESAATAAPKIST